MRNSNAICFHVFAVSMLSKLSSPACSTDNHKSGKDLPFKLIGYKQKRAALQMSNNGF